jgi:hypothetical protein
MDAKQWDSTSQVSRWRGAAWGKLGLVPATCWRKSGGSQGQWICIPEPKEFAPQFVTNIHRNIQEIVRVCQVFVFNTRIYKSILFHELQVWFHCAYSVGMNNQKTIPSLNNRCISKNPGLAMDLSPLGDPLLILVALFNFRGMGLWWWPGVLVDKGQGVLRWQVDLSQHLNMKRKPLETNNNHGKIQATRNPSQFLGPFHSFSSSPGAHVPRAGVEGPVWVEYAYPTWLEHGSVWWVQWTTGAIKTEVSHRAIIYCISISWWCYAMLWLSCCWYVICFDWSTSPC